MTHRLFERALPLPWADAATAERLGRAVQSSHLQAHVRRLSALGEHSEDFWEFEQVRSGHCRACACVCLLLGLSSWQCVSKALVKHAVQFRALAESDCAPCMHLQALWDALDSLQGGSVSYAPRTASERAKCRFICLHAFGRFMQVHTCCLLRHSSADETEQDWCHAALVRGGSSTPDTHAGPGWSKPGAVHAALGRRSLCIPLLYLPDRVVQRHLRGLLQGALVTYCVGRAGSCCE